MNTKSFETKNLVNFGDLFAHKTKDDRIEHKAQMISIRILSEVQKLCDERNIKKKELAELVGTSRSYITQLFRGGKQVNTLIMAKFEEVLDFTFSIHPKLAGETHEEFIAKQLRLDMLKNKRLLGGIYLNALKSSHNRSPKSCESIVRSLSTEDQSLQAAG